MRLFFSPLCKMFSMVQIAIIKLIGIRLALKRNPFVCRIRMENQTEQPFKKIEDVKEDVSKFFHLSGVNSFVIDDALLIVLGFLVPTIFANEHNPEQIYGNVAWEWDYITLYILHRISIVIVSPRR